MTPRKIIHLDLDAFFCAVEELRQPELRGKAFAVGGAPNERGVISTCSYAARQFGVHSAMPTSQALRLCRGLILVSPRHSLYHQASEQVMEYLRTLTPLFEQISIDEAFLDLSDLPQTGLELAKMIQAEVRAQTNLPCSLGVASNKLVAKMATDEGKRRHRSGGFPNAILVVPPGEEAAFMAPLPVEALWGVGPKMGERFRGMGIQTIGELAALSEEALITRFGVFGRDLARHSRGIDDRPVSGEHEVKSISQEITFDKDVADGQVLRRTLRELSEKVAFRLRQQGLCARTVRIKLRWPDFSTHTRQMILEQPADQDGVIFSAAQTLLEGIWSPGRAVRLIGVGASGLDRPAHQLSLWETPSEKERRLLTALDDLRERFGRQAIRRGAVNPLKTKIKTPKDPL